MNSVANGLTATLLMFVPLLAVPFLAAFGVSMPTQDIAAGAVELEALDFAPELPEAGAGHSASARRTPEDLFAPLDETQPTGTPVSFSSSTSNATGMSHPLSLPALDTPPDANTTPSERVEEASQPTSLMVNTPAHQPSETNWNNPFENSPAFGKSTPSESVTPHQPPVDREPSQPSTDYPQDFPDLDTPPRTVSHESANPFDRNANPTETAKPSSSPAVDDSVFGPPSTTPNPPRQLATNDQGQTPGRTLFGPPESNDRRIDIPDPQRSLPREPVATNNAGWEPPPTATSRQPTTPENTRTEKPESWLAARERLQELNITKFSLQPAENDRLFYFRCVSESPVNPRITRNFEASGREPLEAIGRVLTQVEQWRNSNR